MAQLRPRRRDNDRIYSPRVSEGKSKTTFWFVIAVSFVMGYFTAMLVYVPVWHIWLNQVFFSVFSHQKSETKRPLSVATTERLPKPKFEYYTLLTKEKEEVPTLPAKTIATTGAAHTGASQNLAKKVVPFSDYWIQMASFTKREDADKLRASLTLKGFSVKIVPVMQQETMWYRVVLGPFQSLKEAQAEQGELALRIQIKGVIRKLDGL